MLLTGATVRPEQAERWGLVTGRYPTPGELMEAALDLAESTARWSPLSVEATKRACNLDAKLSHTEKLRHAEREFRRLYESKDHEESLLAFFERRPGRFVRG
jgi:enoyl-CoA hydratase/carnithine racemase